MLCSTYCTLEHLRIFSACRHHTQFKGITDQFPVQFLIEHCTQCPVEQLDDLCAVIVLSGIIIGKLQKIASVAGTYARENDDGAMLLQLTFSENTNTSDITPPSGVAEVLKNLLMNIVSNPVDALVNANYIGILAWAIIFGIALKAASETTKTVIENISEATSTAVRWIINLAPFGIMGLIFTTISEQGLGVLLSYGRLICVLVGTMLFVALVLNPIVTFICTRQNPYPLVLRCLKDSGLTAFFTRSSAANIPVNMELCKDLGLDEDTYSISIPLGATINMGGAAITISIMALAAAHTLGISVDFPTALILCILAAASAAGASGVAGGSLLLIPMACSLFGIPNDVAMQVVGVGFIVGVIQDSCETALNSSTDVLYTACACKKKK